VLKQQPKIILYIDDNKSYSLKISSCLGGIMREYNLKNKSIQVNSETIPIIFKNLQQTIDEYQQIALSKKLSVIIINANLKYDTSENRSYFTGIKIAKEIIFNPVLYNFTGPIILVSFLFANQQKYYSIPIKCSKIQNSILSIIGVPTIELLSYPFEYDLFGEKIISLLTRRDSKNLTHNVYIKLRAIYYLKDLLSQFSDHHHGICSNKNLVTLHNGNLTLEIYYQILKINLAILEILIDIPMIISGLPISVELLLNLRNRLTTCLNVVPKKESLEETYLYLVKLFPIFNYIHYSIEIDKLILILKKEFNN
jgi:hypothetical protein